MAGARRGKQAALILHLTSSLADVARVNRGTRLGPGAPTEGAIRRPVDLDLLVHTQRRLDERDFQVVGQISAGAALAPGTCEHLPEQALQNVAHRAEVTWFETGRSTLERGVPVAVVLHAFVRIAQYCVRLGSFLERIFSSGIVRIAIGVVPHRQGPIGLLDLGA